MTYIQERRQEERDRRRGEILDAAEALYADADWDTVTMDQLARRARLSRALIYVYFRDKTDLHFAIVERALERLRDQMLAAEGGNLGLDQLEAIGRAYVAFADEEPHRFAACARFEANAIDPEEDNPRGLACIQMGHQVHEVIVRAIEQGIADGSIRRDLGNPYKTALTLWAFTHGVIQIAQSKSAQIRHEGVEIEALMNHAFQLIRRSLAA